MKHHHLMRLGCVTQCVSKRPHEVQTGTPWGGQCSSLPEQHCSQRNVWLQVCMKTATCMVAARSMGPLTARLVYDRCRNICMVEGCHRTARAHPWHAKCKGICCAMHGCKHAHVMSTHQCSKTFTLPLAGRNVECGPVLIITRMVCEVTSSEAPQRPPGHLARGHSCCINYQLPNSLVRPHRVVRQSENMLLWSSQAEHSDTFL